jgi:hypothetical protein
VARAREEGELAHGGGSGSTEEARHVVVGGTNRRACFFGGERKACWVSNGKVARRSGG